MKMNNAINDLLKSKNIGLVLSGGGYRCIAHVGVLKALEEYHISPKYVSGTSAGALVGALFAAGHSIKTMEQFFKKIAVFKFSRLGRNKPGILDSEKFYTDLSVYFPKNSFSSLNKKLFVTATDLIEGKTKTFSSGNLIEPLMASAALPGVFSPVEINDSLYADGGILDNFPVNAIKNKCDFIIGVDVIPVSKPNKVDFKHSYNVIQRAYYLRGVPNSEGKYKDCNLIIKPTEISNYNIFSNHLDEIFELGYLEAIKQLDAFFSIDIITG